ncbi:MAG: toxin ParE1/3/4 [Limisphaerales bacterium]|jgi:toxin ParE1/3/4
MEPVIMRRPLVVDDLEDHFAFIHQDNPDAAQRFKEQARRDFEALVRMPEMGPRHPMAHPRLKDLRFWPIKRFNNFLIFYRPIENGIEVIRVLHGARDLPNTLENES